jgi:hypothetical protein
MKRSYHLLSILAFLAGFFSMHKLHALTAEQWLGLPTNPSVLTLQREGIAKRAAINPRNI